MSELHKYRIHVTTGTGGTTTTDESAFTAADALTQFRAQVRGDYSVYKVEPLPDAPEPRRGDGSRAVAEWQGFPVVLGGPKRPEAKGDHLRREWATIPTGKLDSAEPSEFQRQNVELHAAIFGHAFGSVTHEQAVAEAKRLRAETQTLKFERDHSRQAAEDHFKEVRALVDAITGSPDPGNHTSPGAAMRIARETREKRDRLRAERDALQRMNEAGSSEVVAEMEKTRHAQRERDALQKRIDAAKAWLGPTGRVGLGVGGLSLLAILEGREP